MKLLVEFQNKWSAFLFDLKLFVPYMLKEFFRSFMYLFKSIQTKSEELNRTYVWVKISIALTLMFFIMKKYNAAAIWLIVFIFAGLRHEWIEGSFRKEHTEKIRRRVEMEAEIKKIKNREKLEALQ